MSELDLAEVEALRLIAEQRVAEGDKRSLHVDAVFLIALIARLRSCEEKLKAAEAVGRKKGILEIAQEYRQEAERLRARAKTHHDMNRAEGWQYKAERWDAEAEKLELRAASREDADAQV